MSLDAHARASRHEPRGRPRLTVAQSRDPRSGESAARAPRCRLAPARSRRPARRRAGRGAAARARRARPRGSRAGSSRSRCARSRPPGRAPAVPRRAPRPARRRAAPMRRKPAIVTFWRPFGSKPLASCPQAPTMSPGRNCRTIGATISSRSRRRRSASPAPIPSSTLTLKPVALTLPELVRRCRAGDATAPRSRAPCAARS